MRICLGLCKANILKNTQDLCGVIALISDKLSVFSNQITSHFSGVKGFIHYDRLTTSEQQHLLPSIEKGCSVWRKLFSPKPYPASHIQTSESLGQ